MLEMLLALAEMPELETHAGLDMRDRVTRVVDAQRRRPSKLSPSSACGVIAASQGVGRLTDFGEESEIGLRARVRLSMLHEAM
jgi:hypothetical protein